MASADELPDDIEQAKTLLYSAPMEEFVAQRDALVRGLRADGRRDEATAVKALRKPSRPAWTLDAGFFSDRDGVERLAVAVNEVIEAQSGRGDMRDATRSLRDAVQDAAKTAADAAKAAGVNVERASLVPALLAVVADQVAFAELRDGHLGEIPTAGALDVLTNPPPLLDVSPVPKIARPESESESESPPPVDLAARRRARAAVKEAEAAATAAHQEADAADQAVEDARTALESTEQALRDAEAEVKAARQTLYDSQQSAKSARTEARQADRDLAAARKNHPDE
jgi:hypothetical protein